MPDPIFEVDPDLLRSLVAALKDAADNVSRMDKDMTGLAKSSEQFVQNVESAKDIGGNLKAAQRLQKRVDKASQKYEKTKSKRHLRTKLRAEKDLEKFKYIQQKRGVQKALRFEKTARLRAVGRGAGRMALGGARAGMGIARGAMAGGLGGAAGAMRALGPVGMAIGAGVMAFEKIAKAMDQINRKIVEQSKDLVRGGGLIQTGLQNLGDIPGSLRDLRMGFTSLEAFSNDFLLAAERFSALKGLRATGLKLTFNDLERLVDPARGGLMGKLADMARVSGQQLEAVSETVGEFAFSVGGDLDDMISLFDKVVSASANAGISTTKFIGVVQQLQREFDLIGVEIENIVKYQKLLAAGGKLTGREEATAAGSMVRAVQSLGMMTVLGTEDIGDILEEELKLVQRRLEQPGVSPAEKASLEFQKEILEAVKKSPVLIPRYIAQLSPQVREAAVLGMLKRLGITDIESLRARREVLAGELGGRIPPELERLIFKVLGNEDVEARLGDLKDSITDELQTVDDDTKALGRAYLEPMTKILDALKEDIMQKIFELLNDLMSRAIPTFFDILLNIMEAINEVVKAVNNIFGDDETGPLRDTIDEMRNGIAKMGSANVVAAKSLGDAAAAGLRKAAEDEREDPERRKELTGQASLVQNLADALRGLDQLTPEQRREAATDIMARGFEAREALEDFAEATEISDPAERAEAIAKALSDIRDVIADIRGIRGAISRRRGIRNEMQAAGAKRAEMMNKQHSNYMKAGGTMSYNQWRRMGMPDKPGPEDGISKETAGASASTSGTGTTNINNTTYIEGDNADIDRFDQEAVQVRESKDAGGHIELTAPGGQKISRGG